MVDSSIRQVKKLPRDSKDWISSNREPGALYLDDPVTEIDVVKGKTQELLAKIGIMTVQDLVGLNGADIKRAANCGSHMVHSIPAITGFKDKATLRERSLWPELLPPRLRLIIVV